MVRLAAPLRPLFPYLKPVYSLGTSAVAPFTILASRSRGGLLPTGVVGTVEEAAERSGGRSWTVRPEEVATRPVPVEGHPIFDAHASEVVRRVAVAELPGGRVLGPHAAVITRDGDLVDEVSRYFGTTRARQHPLFLHPFPPEPLEVDGRVAVLDYKGGAANYYHFVTDVLPRIATVERCPDLEPPDLWYVPAATEHQRHLLDRLGVTEDRRIDSTQVPHVRARTLIVPTAPGDEQHPAWVAEFLRERIVPTDYCRVPGRRLLLTRGFSKHNRMLLNQAEVLAALEIRGFFGVDPGTLAMAEEIGIFAEADIVVSPHGAALTNLLYMSPGSVVVEMFPERNVIPCYWKLANSIPGLKYRYVPGIGDRIERTRQKMLVQDITVDLRTLLTAIDQHL